MTKTVVVAVDPMLSNFAVLGTGGLEVKPSTEIEEYLMATVQQHPTLAPMVRSVVVRKGRGDGE